MAFELPSLPYAYEALEAAIDKQTMQLHHDKHHAAYVNNLNAALEKHADWQNKTVDEICREIAGVPADVRTAVRNNGGGHYNHSMFWQIMSPKGGGQPSGKIAEVIQGLGGFDKFKEQFNAAGTKQFGSGWVWLVRTSAGKFEIRSTPNQDNPLMDGKGDFPIFGNDVWEHAYYLRYQNKRADYLGAWWNVVNWEAINKRLDVAAGDRLAAD
jgi:superoxide dismutase, Fe-Mn family